MTVHAGAAGQTLAQVELLALGLDVDWRATRLRRLLQARSGYFPHGHRKTTTLVAGLRMTGMIAPLVLGGAINGDWFEAYAAQVLVPELRPGDVVFMDNPSNYKRAAVKERIEAASATLPSLPSGSTSLHPRPAMVQVALLH